MDGNESPAKTPIAIIGMACRLPGADTLDDYRDLVLNGRSAIETLPDEVLDQTNYYDARPGISGKMSSRIGGTLRNRSFNHDNCCLPEELTASADLTHLIMTRDCSGCLSACRRRSIQSAIHKYGSLHRTRPGKYGTRPSRFCLIHSEGQCCSARIAVVSQCA